MSKTTTTLDHNEKLRWIGLLAIMIIAMLIFFAAYIYFEIDMYQRWSLAVKEWKTLSIADGKDPIEISRLGVSQFKVAYPEICSYSNLAKHCLEIAKGQDSLFFQYKTLISSLSLLLAGYIGFMDRKAILFHFKGTNEKTSSKPTNGRKIRQ